MRKLADKRTNLSQKKVKKLGKDFEGSPSSVVFRKRKGGRAKIRGESRQAKHHLQQIEGNSLSGIKRSRKGSPEIA